MALRLFLLVALLLFCTLQVSSDSEITDQVKPLTYAGTFFRLCTCFRLLPHDLFDCQGLCQVRCGLHSRKNVCMRACGTCCARCNCVPPGTYGNREACGKCYTDMTTHGNRLKCP
ncbi:hypothetical protein DCAR_0833104 [Daucus carota subsp. sativus]|uniref:Snakin-2 n=1 Tax=Daucus carota subsp. sativus TaxID=79200 RepID=A0AAF1BBJ3_DAUCS|nr:hypothetical protein DCAR_0833104 [Daucus carota subsp. sativus]